MKKSFLISVVCICVAVIGLSVVTGAKSPAVVETNTVSTTDGVYETKLLNMLNHNFVYGTDFDDADSIVRCSLNALTKYRDNNSDYISEKFVIDFVNNMYGIGVEDIESFDSSVQREGYVFVCAGGYTSYKHKNISLVFNEDGTVTANTDVVIIGHDGGKIITSATSLFVPNENSAFGFNIVYSEILDESTPI